MRLASSWNRPAATATGSTLPLLLVLGLRKGELLGLTWEMVSLDNAELHVGERLQRVGRQLLRRPPRPKDQKPLFLSPTCA
jgi:integrase